MSLSIGLEALNKSRVVVEGSFESNYADFLESYSRVQEAAQKGVELFTALENINAIKKTVKQFGFTKSMESLIGHQLGSTRASVEEEATKAGRGLWQKIVDWFKKMWRYVKDFFAKLANTRRGVMLKLKAIKNGKYTVKSDTATFEGLSAADIKSVAGSFTAVTMEKVMSSDPGALTSVPELATIKLSAGQVKEYAGLALDACQGFDQAEKAMKKMLEVGIKMAQNGINKPSEDIAAAREVKATAGALVADVSKGVKRVFVSAKNFVKYVKKAG